MKDVLAVPSGTTVVIFVERHLLHEKYLPVLTKRGVSRHEALKIYT